MTTNARCRWCGEEFDIADAGVPKTSRADDDRYVICPNNDCRQLNDVGNAIERYLERHPRVRRS